MLPSYIVPQIEDGGTYTFPKGKNGLTENNFSDLKTESAIFSNGPMLTVQGTAIQNRQVLEDYVKRYKIIGLEMEAAPYLDAIEKAISRGALRKNLKLNIGYWGSDNPLNNNETLAEQHMNKGFNPAYNLIIGILRNTLNADHTTKKKKSKKSRINLFILFSLLLLFLQREVFLRA
jgi:hypothetical protein